MDSTSGLAPSLGGHGTEPLSALANELRIEASPATPRYWRLDIFAGETLVGEYERSIEAEIERKRGEVSLASTMLLDVFRRHGAFQVRWNGDTRTKDVRVDGRLVATIPRSCWLPPGR